MVKMNETFPPIQVPEKKIMPIEKFIGTYLSHYLQDDYGNQCPSPPFHREIYYLLSNPEKYRKLICVAPRGFAKSVIFQFFSNLFDAVHTKKYKEILILSSMAELSENWLRKIKWELENNEMLIQDYGYLANDKSRASKWSSEIAELKNGVRIIARGYEGKMRGLHPHKICMDDLETDESARSKEQVKKMEMWIRQTVIPMQRSMKSVIHWSGTFLAPDSVLRRAYLGKGWDDSWFRIKYGAYVDKEGNDAPIGASRWPQAFTEEFLHMRYKEMGLYAFASEYLNEPLGALDPLFRNHWMEYYKKEDEPQYKYTVISVDPAGKENDLRNNCETAICCLAANADPEKPTNDIYVLDEHAGRYDTSSIVRMIFDWQYKYKADAVLIESVSAWQMLAENVEREAKDHGMYIPVIPVKPTKDKVTRARSVTPMFEQGLIHFKEEHDPLIQQLLMFPDSSLNDRVDALVQGLEFMMDRWSLVAAHYEGIHAPESGACIPELGIF